MPGVKRGMEDKLRAAFAYIITGNSVDASKLCNVPDRTIREWAESTWWSELVAEAKTAKNVELDAMYTRIMAKAIGQVEERIDNGDVVIDKNGNQVRKSVNAKDLAIIASIFQDKRAIVRGEPTSISRRINERERLKQIASGLEAVEEREQAKGPSIQVVTH